jgi:hypothetical protein
MHRARAFFYVCMGALCLASAFALGARSAGAQMGSGQVAAATSLMFQSQPTLVVVAPDGAVYASVDGGENFAPRGHVFGGSTPAEQHSLGQVKARWR